MKWMIVNLMAIMMATSSGYLHAQRLEASAFIGGTLLTGGTKGVTAMAGSNNPMWNLNGVVSAQWTKSVVEHFMQPDETIHRVDGLLYIEGSLYRIVAVGFSPCALSNDGLTWRPQGIFSLSLPIALGSNVDLVPRLQMMTSLQVSTLPQVFLGVGVSFVV